MQNPVFELKIGMLWKIKRRSGNFLGIDINRRHGLPLFIDS